MQKALNERIITNVYSAHHAKVMRILAQKGFCEEKELVKMSLLPQKNVLAIVNRLLADGYLLTQEMPIKGGSSVAPSGCLLLFGLNQSHIQKKMGFNVTKATLNLLLRVGSLGHCQNLALEMNHLSI